MYVKRSPYVVIHFLELPPKRNISLKWNTTVVPILLSIHLFVIYALKNVSDQLLISKIGLEYTKVTSAPRKIFVVQNDIATNVLIHMTLTNILPCI